MKLSRTKPSKVSFTLECQGQVDGPLDVRLVLGKDKKLSLKTEAFGNDHVVMIPALQEHPWLLEGTDIPATIEVVCEKYFFAPMKKTLSVEDEKKVQVDLPKPDVVEEEPKEVSDIETPAEKPKKMPLITAEAAIPKPPKRKVDTSAVKSLLETAASKELEVRKKEQQQAALLDSLRKK